jgi:hypothetical protein
MNAKLVRILKRSDYLSSNTRTDIDIFKDAMKKEDYTIFYYIFIATLLVMLGNYFGLESIGEWLR